MPCAWTGDHMDRIRRIPLDISESALESLSCGEYNRRGTQCSQCIDGYGPALFSDNIICTDCSKHRQLWILILLFQLIMVTLMCLAFIILKVNGSGSPFNLIIVYSQLIALGFRLSGNVRNKTLCFFGEKFTNMALSLLGFLNLDFFHAILPPLCISTSLKAINILLFDYLIAIFPLAITFLIYLCLELHDRNYRFIMYLSFPIKKCSKFICKAWDPRSTILKTFVTFILLSYSKLLFTSIKLVLAFQAYNVEGKIVPNSAVLIYDPSVRLFHSEHIPYVVLAFFVMMVLIFPLLLLLLYPFELFKKCLSICGFQRWDILHHIMDIFHGWYKDGTEGTRDYRPLSVLHLLLRIGFCTALTVMDSTNVTSTTPREMFVLGIIHLLLGSLFLIVKPYRKMWMNHTDGLIFTTVGVLLFLVIINTKPYYIMELTAGVIGTVFITVYIIYEHIKQRQRNQ